MNMRVNLKSKRSRRARLGQSISHKGETALWVMGLLLIGLAAYMSIANGSINRLGYLSTAVACACLIVAFWQRFDLNNPPAEKRATNLDDNMLPTLLGKLKAPLTPRSVWRAAMQTNEGAFMVFHLLLDPETIANMLSDSEADMAYIWEQADQLRNRDPGLQLHGGTVAAVLITTNRQVHDYLAKLNLNLEEVMEIYAWLDRLMDYLMRPKPYFGGIGRDWATGFTPTLDKFSQNLSQVIERGGSHFHHLAHDNLNDTIIHGLNQGANSIALVGPVGSGKSSLIKGLAERLLEGKDKKLAHYQVVSLNASLILSSDKNDLEGLMMTLFYEAIQSGNVILFLDEAQLFFGEGLGAFNMAQLLLPVLQARRLKIIAAFTPNEFQKLKAMNESLANLFSVVTVKEPPMEDVIKTLEDTALTVEGSHDLLVTFQAIREAYRLSGQYMSDRAYPGKAITLLKQAAPLAEHKVVTAGSVQLAIEKMLGVKPGAATAVEADVLLNLEAKIHERMINQTQAVNAVAAALRRVRAGVTNPNRPAGSFLFLGPTGVGKTELAKSLASTYFGDEKNMIRLDMSEYQQPEDVARLLADGSGATDSLILSIRRQPFSVVLLDEVEKAHPNILNLLLQLLDEGQLTDQSGRPASFKSAMIIATSNAGAADIMQKINAGQELAGFERELIDKLISNGQFRPELINRFDEVVLFRPLNEGEMAQVAKLMLAEVNRNLSKQNIRVELTETALAEIARVGYDPQFGARPMRRVIQKTVEDAVATRILRGDVGAGGLVTLDLEDIKKS